MIRTLPIRTLSVASLASCFVISACVGEAAPDAPGPETEQIVTSDFTIALEPVTEGLEFPWGVAFLPDGSALVTEVAGGIRYISPDGTLAPAPLAGVPAAMTEGQGGYLGLALDPDFATNRIFYMSFSEGTPTANTTAVMKARLSDDMTAVETPEIIFRGTERETAYHFGSRLAFMADGTLLVTLGEGFRYMDRAQETDNYLGKIVRINTDGTIPEDNPFTDGEAPAIWSYGHRNMQGLLVDEATGKVWEVEHGPKGGDELNLIQPGRNYGWPVITYGIDYDGSIISDKTAMEGMEQPVVKWVPSLGVSGLALNTGDVYDGWQGDLFAGGMEGPAGLKLVRIDLDGSGKAVGQEYLLTEEARPIRDVVQGPGDYLYVLTKELDGGLYRLVVE